MAAHTEQSYTTATEKMARTNASAHVNGVRGVRPSATLHSPLDQHDKEPVAICGMAMRLPGNISSDADFWKLLIEKGDARGPVPADRFNIDAFHSNVDKAFAIRPAEGYFLEHVDLACFDASFFSLTKSEVEKLDPQHRLLLELTRECLESAGETDWRGKNIGCYVGTFAEDWLEIQTRDTQESTKHRVTGYGDYLLSNRISYEYDFRGPSVTVKTACSSSLTGLDMAVKALQGSDISSAIVGGVNLIMGTGMTRAMGEHGVLSPNSSCRAFDADADGYVRAEAASTLFIKRLDDAIRDGNPIRGLIRSTGINYNGKTPGIAQPSAAGQEALIRACYESAGIKDFGETAFIECHGTGTQTGDIIEATAVANVFGDSGIYIGSVKPNLGHGEGAAGLTSVIKAVLALEHRCIPPNIKFEKPNTTIPFQRGRLHVPVNTTPWPPGKRERISVSSYGIGGANAHVILDSAASLSLHHASEAQPNGTASGVPRLMVFTGNHSKSVEKLASLSEAYVQDHSNSVEDMAYTLGARREHLPYRSFAVIDGLASIFSPVKRAPDLPPGVVFVFNGQGAQWATMGASMIRDFPAVSRDLELMNVALSELAEPPAWTIQGKTLNRQVKDMSRVNKSEFSQPLCTALQIVIINLLRSWGISPDAVVGHSSGEIAAAYACGALTIQEAIVIAYLRGLASAKQPIRSGAMAAVGLGRDAVSPFLDARDGVVIACENSPVSVTLSGDRDGIDAVIQRIKDGSPNTFARMLKVEHAYHSPHMEQAGKEFERMLGSYVSSKAPAVPLFSSQTNELIRRKNVLNASYWRTSYDHPVLFHTAVEKLLKTYPFSQDGTVLLEIGPHSTLAGPIRQILKATGSNAYYIPTLERNKNETRSMLAAVGDLFSQRVSTINFGAMNPKGKTLHDLPHYPWSHEARYWYESRMSRQYRFREFAHHDLLGSRVQESSDLQPVWRNMLRVDNVPWLRDHVIGGDIVFPGAAYISMAGEAIRQIVAHSGNQDGNSQAISDFTLRNFSPRAALVIHEQNSTEIIFNLRPLRLTDSLDSEWYEFAIMSYKGGAAGSWTKNCVGNVRAGSDISNDVSLDESLSMAADLPRSLQSASWYRLLREAGMSYGPRFQGLDHISAHPVQHCAVAHISDTISEADSVYHLHPSTIDACIQLFIAAACKGQSRSMTRVPLVPTRFGEIYVRSPTCTKDRIVAKANATFNHKGGVDGSAIGLASGKVIVRLENVRFAPLGSHELDHDQDPPTGVYLKWKPDLCFQQIAHLIGKPVSHLDAESISALRELALLYSAEACSRLAAITTHDGHSGETLKRYRRWLQAVVDKTATNGHERLGLPTVKKNSDVDDLLAQVKKVNNTRAIGIGIALTRVLDNIEPILRGRFIANNDMLSRVFELMPTENLQNCQPFIRLLAHKKPHLKILEIGSLGVSMTETVLHCLSSKPGERMFYSYTLTKYREESLETSKKKFGEVEGVNFQLLDFYQSLEEQGLEPRSFDLILAANTFNTSPDPKKTLRNIMQLLKPSGSLILQELCEDALWLNFVLGILPGWWPRTGGPSGELPTTPGTWKMLLDDVGFDGAKSVVINGEPSRNSSITIVASPRHPLETLPSSVCILARRAQGPVANAISTHLSKHGLTAHFISIDDDSLPQSDIISILDLEESDSFIANVSPVTHAHLQGWIARLQASSKGVLWVTKACQIRPTEPQYAQILGLARTMRNECAIDFTTLELDDQGSGEAMDAICSVYREFQARPKVKDTAEVGPEYEYAFANGTIFIPRFCWISVTEELNLSSFPADNSFLAPKSLEVGKRGSLQGLQWKLQPPHSGPVGYEVLIDVRAVGMNFKDVLLAMNIVESQNIEANRLGCECSGVVAAIGPDVRDLDIGDRVCVGATGTWTTNLRTTTFNCVKIPDSLTFEDAATMPCVYGTVIHGLVDLARVYEGQSVLIHSACGGIGIAAINVCRMVGAEIYATVGTEEKVKYLVNTFGIPRNRIFNSRDSSFLPLLMSATQGKGVDVALNSLSGDLLHATWKCVADFGSMVEIGKRDLIGHGQLAMSQFEPNRSYFGVDLAQMYIERPKKVKRMIKFFIQGGIQPIRPVTCFEVDQVENAFRSLQKGQHIGKLVVRLPKDHSLIPAVMARRELELRSDASYLLVGGLGGLGRSVSIWLAEHGARNLIFLSRTATLDDTNTRAFVNELAAMGCGVQLAKGSVASATDVGRVIAEARMPIAGVMQMSMVLRDASYANMTHEDWESVMKPKVQGTWNLHSALLGQQLDFFILFSSDSGTVGNPGQANYAAANTFLDAFVQFRHSQGLTAAVLDIGVVGDIGYASQNQTVANLYKARSAHFVQEQELLDSLDLAIRRSSPHPEMATILNDGFLSPGQIGVGLRTTQLIDSPDNRITWKFDVRMSAYRNYENIGADVTSNGNTGETDSLKELLAAASKDALILKQESSITTISWHIGATLLGFMMKPTDGLDIKASPATLGVDSLVAIEVRDWCRQRFGIDVSVLKIMGLASIEKLGGFVAQSLMAKLGAKETGAPESEG
ncbi:hypothetical protein F5Y10DRAFT_284293 [Nemania abortiva]|nr:hypothetical protein F5Y10DRAFT_284293 [Nemania abortiva]